MTTSKGARAFSLSSAPERYRWLPTAEIVEALELRPGMNLAEIGAGASDFVLAASQAIHPGRAFPVAMAPRGSELLRDGLREHQNIEVGEDSASIPDGSCDRVLMANVWSALPDAMAALREAARLLREDGRLIVVDWHQDAQCPEAPAERIGFGEMVRLLEHNAWDIHQHGEAGPYSYYLVAGVSDEGVQS